VRRVAGLGDAQNALASPHLLTRHWRRMSPIKDDAERGREGKRGFLRPLLLLLSLLPHAVVVACRRRRSLNARARARDFLAAASHEPRPRLNGYFWCQPYRPSSRITAPRIAATIADGRATHSPSPLPSPLFPAGGSEARRGEAGRDLDFVILRVGALEPATRGHPGQICMYIKTSVHAPPSVSGRVSILDFVMGVYINSTGRSRRSGPETRHRNLQLRRGRVENRPPAIFRSRTFRECD